MEEITKKIHDIQQLLQGEKAMLNTALKNALDFVEEYGQDARLKKQAISICWELRQQKIAVAEGVTQLVQLLEHIAANPFLLSLADTQRFPIIRLENIAKKYQSHNFNLQPITLSLALGNIMGIVGANANGKSTLIKIMVGELLPDSGKVHFPYFQNTMMLQQSWLSLKHKIAYIPQELPAWHGSLRENLHLEATLHGLTNEENKLRTTFILERLGLTDFIHRAWNELSGGYKLRFTLAKSLIWKPSLLVLDEPLANLDMASQMILLHDLKDLVSSQRFPLSIIITSQHIHEIEQVANELVVLEEGKMIYNGHPQGFQIDSELLIFEFSCQGEWAKLADILRGSPLQSLQKQGNIYIVKYAKKAFSVQQFFQFMEKNALNIQYFRDITTSVKQLFIH
jgi:ABC-2 type transport system ATP-binding protein